MIKKVWIAYVETSAIKKDWNVKFIWHKTMFDCFKSEARDIRLSGVEKKSLVRGGIMVISIHSG